jgi:hypothetical protein
MDGSGGCGRAVWLASMTAAPSSWSLPSILAKRREAWLVRGAEMGSPAGKHTVGGMAAGWAARGADLIPDGNEERNVRSRPSRSSGWQADGSARRATVGGMGSGAARRGANVYHDGDVETNIRSRGNRRRRGTTNPSRRNGGW